MELKGNKETRGFCGYKRVSSCNWAGFLFFLKEREIVGVSAGFMCASVHVKQLTSGFLFPGGS